MALFGRWWKLGSRTVEEVGQRDIPGLHSLPAYLSVCLLLSTSQLP
jgi:hypothetical protein